MRRILIVRLSSLGDVLSATPVAQAIREAIPDAHIGWAVEKRCAPLLEGNPYINRLHIWDRTFFGLLKLIHEVRSEHYEMAIDFQGLLKSAIITLASGARYRVGFSDGREGATFALTHKVEKAPSFHPSGMSLQLLKALGIEANVEKHRMLIPISDTERCKVEELMRSHGLRSKGFIVLAPATRWAHKHWVEERWAELANAVYERWHMSSVLIGGEGDSPLLKRIANRSASSVHLFAGLVSLRECAYLIAQASALIGVDSFPAHVGYAMGVPTLILYGPTSPLKWRMAKGVYIIEHDLSCRPCYRHPKCDGKPTCMQMITVDEVLKVLEIVL
jgi:heptosyltransferase-1